MYRNKHHSPQVHRLRFCHSNTPRGRDFADLNPFEQHRLVETLRTDYSVRQICETLGFNKISLYYQPKSDPSEVVLQTEIEQLAARYPTYRLFKPVELEQQNLS